MKKYLTYLFVAIISVACSNQNKTGDTQEEATEAQSEEPQEMKEEVPAVCVWDNISVRETASSKSKWLTSISLGERIVFMGDEALDSTDNDRLYYKIRLADDTEGWAIADFIIPESSAGAFIVDADVYKRPDLLTKDDKSFSQMDIVAVKSTQDDWLEVVGRRSGSKWIENGWVKNNTLSQKDVDIAVAKFAAKALNVEDVEEKAEAIQEILDNSDLSGSSFHDLLKAELEQLQAPVEPEVSTDTLVQEADSIQ